MSSIPKAWSRPVSILKNLTYCGDPYACCEGASALVIVTEWDAFRALDLSRVKSLLGAPVLVDLRNIYDPDEVIRQGFTYVSVGRGRE